MQIDTVAQQLKHDLWMSCQAQISYSLTYPLQFRILRTERRAWAIYGSLISGLHETFDLHKP